MSVPVMELDPVPEGLPLRVAETVVVHEAVRGALGLGDGDTVGLSVLGAVAVASSVADPEEPSRGCAGDR